VRRRKLLRDLEAGVPATDHEHRPGRHLVRPAVANSVRLEDIVGEPFGQLRHICRVERAGRDHDPVSGDRPSINLEAEAPVVAEVEPLDLAVELDRELEGLGVAVEVCDHLVPGRVAVGVTWKGKPGQPAVAPRREERQ
jgi:hypothetical protein